MQVLTLVLIFPFDKIYDILQVCYWKLDRNFDNVRPVFQTVQRRFCKKSYFLVYSDFNITVRWHLLKRRFYSNYSQQSGYFLPVPQTPAVFRFLSSMSPFHHSYHGLMLVVYANRPPLVKWINWNSLISWQYYQECRETYCHYKHPSKFLDNLDIDTKVFRETQKIWNLF